MLFFWLLLLCALAPNLLHAAEWQRKPPATLSRRQYVNQTNSASCATDPNWTDSVSAWTSANADSKLQDFLANITEAGSTHFDQALGSQFGAHYPAFKCGIDLYSCPLPACSDFQNNPDDRWAYLATVSTVRLANKFSILHSGITNGQLDFQGVIDDLADHFFDWKDPVFVGDDVAFWVVAITTVLFSVLTLGVEAPEAALAIVGLGTFLGAATQETSLLLTPPDGVPRSAGISFLKKLSAQIGESSRGKLETWANATFTGASDSQGNTIVDYFSGGGFLVDTAVPTAAEAEKFYKSSMIARTINGQWKTKANFLMFASTNDPNAACGPSETRYYSDVKAGIYNLYNYDSGKLEAPSGMSVLNDPAYGISPYQVTKSSARSWEVGGNDYTTEIAMSRIQESFKSNSGLTPYHDGPESEGMFTIPVCDVGSHVEWLTQYGGNGLPCCCGPNCKDTKAFVHAANLQASGSLLSGCKQLLKGSSLNFDSIDYGITAKRTFQQKWDTEWSTGQKAGITIGLWLAGCASLIILVVISAGIITAIFG